MSELRRQANERGLRAGCKGIVPLTARLEQWQIDLFERPKDISTWLDLHGSPLNIIDPAPMARNSAELEDVARRFDLDFRIYFARKANKALALVDAAHDLGLGVDVASEQELRQVLGREVPADDLVVTAAIKPTRLLELCLESGATVVADNSDELDLLVRLAQRSKNATPVALRLAPRVTQQWLETRFGLPFENAVAAGDRYRDGLGDSVPGIAGVHFHLDGYLAGDRVAAIAEALELVDALRERGHRPGFIDIGGGIPMSYLESESEWRSFWVEHKNSLLGEREALTFDRHGLGLTSHGGEIVGRPSLYPYFQRPVRAEWLAQVLSASLKVGGVPTTVADAIRSRRLQLRCEPGRSLLDGCGVTAARIEFRKQRLDGTWLIGLEMNRTQCRSTSDDFLVDPLLLRPHERVPAENTGQIEGYLVGAYCIERELITWRRLSFPAGVEVGDVVVFPNTAGYLMHILESSAHQIPLALNLVARPEGTATLDPIDAPGLSSTASRREQP